MSKPSAPNLSSNQAPADAPDGKLAQIGVIGLAVMGSNIARNFANHGHTVAVFNRTFARTEAFMESFGEQGSFIPAETLEAFVASLEKPRRALIMVQAGPATDAMIEQLAELMDPGDIIIDGGNALYTDCLVYTSDAADDIALV